MTRGLLFRAAAAALLLAAAGQSAHLFTRQGQRARPRDAGPVPQAGGPAAGTSDAAKAALEYAQKMLACPVSAVPHADRPCGAITDVDTAVRAGADGHAVVMLTATLHPQPGRSPARAAQMQSSPAAGTLTALPVAVRLELTRTSAGWIVLAGQR